MSNPPGEQMLSQIEAVLHHHVVERRFSHTITSVEQRWIALDFNLCLVDIGEHRLSEPTLPVTLGLSHRSFSRPTPVGQGLMRCPILQRLMNPLRLIPDALDLPADLATSQGRIYSQLELLTSLRVPRFVGTSV